MKRSAVLTIDGFAEEIGMSRSWVEKALARGELRCVRLGSRVLFRRSYVDEFLAEREESMDPARDDERGRIGKTQRGAPIRRNDVGLDAREVDLRERA